MAALTFFAERLRVTASRLIGDEAPTWSRLEADLHLAAGRWVEAYDAYTSPSRARPNPRVGQRSSAVALKQRRD